MTGMGEVDEELSSAISFRWQRLYVRPKNREPLTMTLQPLALSAQNTSHTSGKIVLNNLDWLGCYSAEIGAEPPNMRYQDITLYSLEIHIRCLIPRFCPIVRELRLLLHFGIAECPPKH